MGGTHTRLVGGHRRHEQFGETTSFSHLFQSASAGGGYTAGGGYDGHHGKSLGGDHIESEVYPLDGSVTQRTLDSSLTERLCVFEWDGRQGSGIFDFASSRSSSYTYSPTLR